MFQTKVVEEIKIHILCSKTFFRKSCRLLYNVEKYCRAGQVTGNNIAHAHCVLELTPSQHVIFIAFPLQQWLHEHASMLRHTYGASVVLYQTANIKIYSTIIMHVVYMTVELGL